MKKRNALFNFLKDPPLWFFFAVWFLTLCAAAGSVAVAALSPADWSAYALYGATAILLGYSVYTVVRFAPRIRKKFIDWSNRHAFTSHLFGDYGFRTVAFSVLSFAVNIGFALFNAVLGIVYRSVWYGVFAAYYFSLSALRGLVLLFSYRIKQRTNGDGPQKELLKTKLYRMCGVALLLLEIALGAAVTLTVLYDRPVKSTQVMAITVAAYTFYKLIFAIINLVKVKKYGDPALQSLRNIKLSEAAVSLLSLQVTLISVFSDGAAAERLNALNAVTGFAVCTLTMIMGIVMIVRASKKIKILGEESRGQKI